MDSSKVDAFDLDDYFSSPDGYALSYTASGNSSININIDPNTHIVSFSQTSGWFGAEEVYFYAADTENNVTQSNKVTLQVENIEGPDKPTIVDIQVTPSPLKENDLVRMTIKSYDLDNDDISFSYSNFFSEARRWKEGDFWFSESTWQTDFNDHGNYNIRVTATDTSGLSDTRSVLVKVCNLNRPPVLEPILYITKNEGDLVIASPQATDADGDALTYYYFSPLDSSGRWLTDYDDAGVYSSEVVVSDGIDTVSQPLKIIVNNVNRAPQISLTLDKYTADHNESINIMLTASEPDGDAMTFSLKKDDQEFASGTIIDTYLTTTYFVPTGDHAISATVTDSFGLATTETKVVDVVDPHPGRNPKIRPMSGDFNADSLTDLGFYMYDDLANVETWEVCVSDKGVFRNAVVWLSSSGSSTREFELVGGDFNGDGIADIGMYKNTTGELKVALCSGSSFSALSTWLTISFATSSWQFTLGNFNADRWTDCAMYNTDTGEVKVALGQVSGFGAFTTWLTGFGTGYSALTGDFNGDGLTDFCLFKKSIGEFKVAFSNGSGFVNGTSWITGFATDKDIIISDFNDDGLTDIGYRDDSNYNWYYAISTGSAFVNKGLWLEAFGANLYEDTSTGDFNGDGITDAANFNRSRFIRGIDRWTVRLSSDRPADLLTGIDNGIGGKTKISYGFASMFENNLVPFPVYVASSISLIDTLPTNQPQEIYTQEFSYQGGYYDSQEQEFNGFRKIKVTDPITGNYSETYFHQGRPPEDGALKGQVEKIFAYDGNNRLISQVLNTYEVKKSNLDETRTLGFPALKEQNSTVWEENGLALTTRDKYTYDNIGNLIEEVNEGDISLTGDDKIVRTTLAKAYTLGFNSPLETILEDKDGNIVTKKNFEYDTIGNLKKEISLISNPITQEEVYAITEYGYDAYGNIYFTINDLDRALDRVTSMIVYDYTNYTYPIAIFAYIGAMFYIYDPRFGKVTQVTDPNGNISTTDYDSFGRVTRIKNAYDQLMVEYSYPDFNTNVIRRMDLVKTEYIDGLSRKYKTVSSGEDGILPRDVATEAFYNERGLVEKESLSRYVDEDPEKISYTRYEYDLLGRLKKSIDDFPGVSKDTQVFIDYLSPLYAETMDAMGRRQGARKDVFGNTVEVIEFCQDGVYHTYYEYDIQNNLTKVVDSQDNTTRLFYDTAGRKVRMIDPDMGEWSYEYDLVGNLKKQSDPKGQVLEFEYDRGNRLTAKRAGGQTIVTYFYDTYDDEDRSPKENCFGRLSKVIDSSGSTEFFYDKVGKEIKSIKTVDGIPYVLERGYDVLERITTLKYPDGELVSYTYDTNSGLLKKIESLIPGNGPYTYIQDIPHNAFGQIKSIQYGNGVSTEYYYGQDLRLSQILTGNSSSTLQDLNYTFDKNGNIITLTDNPRSNVRTFFYDDLDRLIEARNMPDPRGGYTTFSFRYDSIGNMVYKSDVGVMNYGQNAGPHALTSCGGYTYQYDANGNIISGKNKIMEYDIENRLTKVDELSSSTAFVYDGDGGRVKQTTTIGEQSAQTSYIGNLYEVHSTDGNPLTISKHIFAGTNRVCTVTKDEGRGTTDVSFYHSDHLGSSSIITDASGSQVEHYEYTPYGTIAVSETVSRPSFLVHHKFTGKELDNTGLYFYGARYYDPEIGRFITADPTIQRPYDPQDLNRYSYCRNNPINYTDPSGLSWWKKAWRAIKKPLLAAVIVIIAVAVPYILAGTNVLEAFSMTATLVAGSSSAASAVVLGTGEGRQLIERVGKEVFVDILGMSPKRAYRWSSIFMNIITSFAFEWAFASLISNPISAEKYDPAKHTRSGGSVSPKGPIYGPSPSENTLFSQDELISLVDKTGKQVGTLGVARVPALGLDEGLSFLGVNHTGASMTALTGSTKLSPFTYLTYGVCHTATNVSFLQAGFGSNLITLGSGGWTTYVTTAIYGNYGGGLARTAFTSVTAYKDYE
ncbi:MAG: hypothetical protein A2987_04765 [Omnitrophica bacterium RIFCSPLOWO2_01_FULL_45_10]|nr:MAG: hypothetical protein A2987_04765 [Omnitrophica bacterium RIFCSPLOWO2_01_FULL_45_10]